MQVRRCLAVLALVVTASPAYGQQTAARIHSEQQGLRALSLTYDTEAMNEAFHAEQNELVLALNGFAGSENDVAGLIIEDLADATGNQRQTAALTPVSATQVAVRVEGLEPHHVYRIWVTIFPADGGVQVPAIGYVRLPYYMVSWSDDPAETKRRVAVTGALQHYYKARIGRAGNMDCWAFTRHYLAPHFPNWNRRNHYGRDLPGLVAEGSIIGDYVRIPDYHSLLVLAYNEATGTIWSVEGNFNSTIEVVSRRQFGNWWVTHL